MTALDSRPVDLDRPPTPAPARDRRSWWIAATALAVSLGAAWYTGHRTAPTPTPEPTPPTILVVDVEETDDGTACYLEMDGQVWTGNVTGTKVCQWLFPGDGGEPVLLNPAVQ